jgi:hypothetical protein
MKYTKTLTIPKAEAKRASRLCAKPPTLDEVDRDSTEYDWTVTFDDGMVIAVQVCTDSEPDEHACWCQAVLFEQTGTDYFNHISDRDLGTRVIPVLSEVSCSEVEEDFLGEWEFEYDGNEYVVNVVIAS